MFFILKKTLLHKSYKCAALYRIHCLLMQHKTFSSRLIRKLIYSKLSQKTIEINTIYEIGAGILFPHPFNIVIGGGAKIGEGVTIYNGVTLGSKNIENDNIIFCQCSKEKYPIIEDGVIIFTGAKILGNVRIGRNSIIGANSVVLDSFPQNSIVAGVPARLIGIRSDK